MSHQQLVNIKYKVFKKFLLLAILFICLLCYLLNKEISIVYSCYGIYNDKTITLNIPINYSDTIKNMEYVKVNNEYIEWNINSIGDVLLDSENKTNYQEVILDVNENFGDNLVVNVSIYYNKEKILKKIKNIIWR